MKSYNWEEFSRQPHMAVWQILLKSVIQLIKAFWPIILVILVRSDGEEDITEKVIFILFPTIAFITAFVEYLFFKFRITDEEVQVKSGIFSRKQIALPLQKIQAVHINQNWIQKIFNISELAFDTPGSEEAEVKIQLNTLEAEKLMSFVLNKRTEKELSQNKDHLISDLSFRDLLKLGLTANHFETLLILIGVFLSFINNIKDILKEYNEDLLEISTNRILESGIMFIIMGILAIMLLSVIVSLFRTLFAYINFRITKTDQGFNISKGLINSSQQLVPFKKVQYVSWKTNWLRKKVPIFLFEFHTIGGKAIKNNLKIKAPVTSELTIQKLATTYIHDIPEQFASNLKIHPSYLYRNTLFFGIIPSAIFAIPLFLFTAEQALLLILLPLYAFLYFWLYSRKFLFSWTSNLVHINTGIFGNRTVLLKWDKIQSVKISQSPYQQRKFLADLSLHTAGGTITAPYIPLEA
ncbi:MAG: PH domain-containing protein, partial [Daejeonella sp.]|uniref:PH domain-containing protein n=1 Tax=Daejeonella sp. TaxID=2805397 RepID=UPI003C78ADD5